VRIVALADRHPERRDPVARQFGIPQVFDSVTAMLESAELDFLDICTRPYSHASLVRQGAERGLPVLCQKPFCTTLEEAREIVDHCQRVGVRLMINENFRWQPWYRIAKEILLGGMLGHPFLATMHQRSRKTLPRFNYYQRYFAEMPRLILYELGTHQLDVMRFLFGDPDTIYARLHRVSPDVQGEDVEALVLGYPELTCLIHESWASVPIPERYRTEDQRTWFPQLFEIDGTEGTLSIRADGSVHLFTDSGNRHWECPKDGAPRAHTATLQHFIDCMESGQEFETSGSETLKTMALVYGCYRSAEEGRVVRASELPL
jgi:predicted dehydrogenase